MFPQVTDFARSKKTMTKFAIAKKLAKKHIQVNTKLTFDDEGKVGQSVVINTTGMFKDK